MKKRSFLYYFNDSNEHHKHDRLWGIVLTRKMQDKGYGTEALQRSVAYGFSELGLRRIYLAVYADHPRVIHVYAKCGFREYDRNDVDLFMEIVNHPGEPASGPA